MCRTAIQHIRNAFLTLPIVVTTQHAFPTEAKTFVKEIFFFFCSKDNKNGCQNAFNPGGGNGAKPFSHAGILERIERFLQVFISRIYFF